MSGWILDGRRVTGKYLNDEDLRFTGVVTQSRVAYGGTVKHHVKLDKPITVYGAERDSIQVESEEILTIDN